MITRAQAEALLTLAESLEACERVGVEIGLVAGAELFYGQRGVWIDIDSLSGRSIRGTVQKLIPKSET